MHEAFETDPVAVFADVIKNGNPAGMTKAAICKAVAERGISAKAVEKAWKPDSLKKHPHIVLHGGRNWAWSDESPEQVPGIHLQTLTELAIDIEELVANGAGPESVLERIHLRMKAQGLTPIGKIDERIAFDRLRHRAAAGSPADGSMVFVVRPGYLWHAGGKEILVQRALVSRQ